MKYLLLLFLLLIAACTPQPTVCFGNDCFNVEVVSDEQSRNEGLMFREYLPPDKGMLFVFEKEGNYFFWMKNTLIPLDIIWINENSEVVYVERNVQPCKTDTCPSYGSGISLYVLEVNAGSAKNIHEGDKVNINLH